MATVSVKEVCTDEQRDTMLKLMVQHVSSDTKHANVSIQNINALARVWCSEMKGVPAHVYSGLPEDLGKTKMMQAAME